MEAVGALAMVGEDTGEDASVSRLSDGLCCSARRRKLSSRRRRNLKTHNSCSLKTAHDVLIFIFNLFGFNL